jgi:hypothetical protein
LVCWVFFAQPHGTGSWSSEKGTIKKYEGDWFHGKRHGKANVAYANGDKYVGDYAENQMHGTGKFTFANGATVDGRWSNGVKDTKTTIMSAKNGSALLIELTEEGPHIHLEPPTVPSFDVTLAM